MKKILPMLLLLGVLSCESRPPADPPPPPRFSLGDIVKIVANSRSGMVVYITTWPSVEYHVRYANELGELNTVVLYEFEVQPIEGENVSHN